MLTATALSVLFVSACVKSSFAINTSPGSLPRVSAEQLRRNIESLFHPQPFNPSAASPSFANDRKSDQDVIKHSDDDETSIPLQKEYLQFMEEFVFFRQATQLNNKFEDINQIIGALTEQSSDASYKILCDKLYKHKAFAIKLLEHRTVIAHIDVHKTLESWATKVIDQNPHNIFLSKLFQAKIMTTMFNSEEFTATINRFLDLVYEVKKSIDKYCSTISNRYIEESPESRAKKREIHSAEGHVSQKEIDTLSYQYFGYHLYVVRTQLFLSYLKPTISKKLITGSTVLSEMECEYITSAVQYMQAVFRKMKTQTKKMDAVRNQLEHDLAMRNSERYVSPHQEVLIAFIQSAQRYSLSDHFITGMAYLCNTEAPGYTLNERKLSGIRYVVGYYTRTQEERTPLTDMIVSNDKDYSKLQFVNDIISSIEYAVRYRRDILNVAKKWKDERTTNRLGPAREVSNIIRKTCGELKDIQAVCRNLHGHGCTPLEEYIPTVCPMEDEKTIKTYFEQDEPCDEIDEITGVLKSHKISAYRLSEYFSGLPNIDHRWDTLIEVEINDLIDECKALCSPEDTLATSEKLSHAVFLATKKIAYNLNTFVSWLIAYHNLEKILAHTKNITAACGKIKKKENRQFVLIETLQYLIFYDNMMSNMELPLPLTEALGVINSQGGIVRTLISDQIQLTITNTDVSYKNLQKAESEVMSSLIQTLNIF